MNNLKYINIQFFAEENSVDYGSINTILSKINTKGVTAETTEEFSSLPDGYYIAQLESAKITTSKASGLPMVAWKFKTIDNGIRMDENLTKTYVKQTKNKKISVYHSLKDESTTERFISDALKFEGEVAGESYIDKEYFTTAETMEDALELLIGLNLWLHIDTDNKGDTWTRFVSWSRAKKLGLEE